MLTLALYGLLAILVAAALFLLAAWLLPAGEQIAPVIRDEPIWQLPVDERLDLAAVAAVKLPVSLRGYRFAETDLLLDRLGEELRERDDEIARLRARLDGPLPSPTADHPQPAGGPTATETADTEPADTEPADDPTGTEPADTEAADDPTGTEPADTEPAGRRADTHDAAG